LFAFAGRHYGMLRAIFPEGGLVCVLGFSDGFGVGFHLFQSGLLLGLVVGLGCKESASGLLATFLRVVLWGS
jgi:hypothetical protein